MLTEPAVASAAAAGSSCRWGVGCCVPGLCSRQGLTVAGGGVLLETRCVCFGLVQDWLGARQGGVFSTVHGTLL